VLDTTIGGPADKLVADGEAQDTDAVFDKWRTELAGGGGWRGQVSSFEDWLKRNFDISFAAFRIGPRATVSFEPKPKTTVLLAQAASPGRTGTWTLMTAPSDEQLLAGATALAAIGNWSQVAGQFTTYTASTGRVETTAAVNTDFIVTQPLSLQNTRLIAANWLSSNIVFYAIGLVGASILLGILTSALLRRLGRPS
jgi:hypothetical protein